MTFKQWAKKDENDIRTMHVTMETSEGELITLKSGQKISYSMMFRIQEAKVKETRLV